MIDDPQPVIDAVRSRHRQLIDVLTATSDDDLAGPSTLPGWSRLTIVCHLRYGARASFWMTEDTVAGRSTAFYPGGRARVRDATLRPEPGESTAGAVESLIEASSALDDLWAGLDDDQWTRTTSEPPDNPDLGPITLAHLALLRLTEVEVHGTDLDLEAEPWSEVFVNRALPQRLHWLTERRSNNRRADASISGSWRFHSPHTDLTVTTGSDGTVTVTDGPADGPTDCVFRGSGAELLAALLGRAPLARLVAEGEPDGAQRFQAAFPPP